MHKMIFGWVAAMALITAFFVWVMPKDDLEAITTYTVNPTTLNITLSSGEAGRTDASIWKKILTLLPHDYLRQHVTQFYLFTDGAADTLAYVSKTNNDSKSWTLAVDRTDYRFFKDIYFNSTIIHEFAHILALEDGQLRAYHWRCDNFSNLDGCFKADSYINHWYLKFWAGNMAEKHRLALTSTKKSERDKALVQFYDANSDSFVSEYASTNAVEDFAESFVHYVLSEEVVNEDVVYSQKTRFFNRFPELVDVRDHIRSTLKE